MAELYLHSSTRLHGIVLNKLSTGMALPFTIYVLKQEAYTSSVFSSTCPTILLQTNDEQKLLVQESYMAKEQHFSSHIDLKIQLN
jgi:hypothetical protein